eukprot:c13864_g1_i1 orf=662-1324(+)
MSSLAFADSTIPVPHRKLNRYDSSSSGRFDVQQSSAAAPQLVWDKSGLQKKLKVVDMAMRMLAFFLLTISLAIMVTSSQRDVVDYLGFHFTLHLKWKYFQPFKFLVVVSSIIAGYYLLQLIWLAAKLFPRFSSVRNCLWFVCAADQVCAYAVLSASAAAAGAASIHKFQGLDELDLPNVCQILHHFCNRITTSILLAVLASFCSACCAALDIFILFLQSL